MRDAPIDRVILARSCHFGDAELMTQVALQVEVLRICRLSDFSSKSESRLSLDDLQEVDASTMKNQSICQQGASADATLQLAATQSSLRCSLLLCKSCGTSQKRSTSPKLVHDARQPHRHAAMAQLLLRCSTVCFRSVSQASCFFRRPALPSVSQLFYN